MRTAQSLHCWWLGLIFSIQCKNLIAFHAHDEDDRDPSSLEGHYNFHRYWREKPRSTRTGTYPLFECPKGHYRDFGDSLKGRPGGILLDGCIKCPKGHYGNSTDLQTPKCTSPCPKGTYLDRKGGTSIDDCVPCPEGTYGEKEGMITSQCSGSCSDHNTINIKYYSNRKGLTTRDDCKVCPRGYYGWQCSDRQSRRVKETQRDRNSDKYDEGVFEYSSYVEKLKRRAIPRRQK